jgi:hypothetical protein
MIKYEENYSEAAVISALSQVIYVADQCQWKLSQNN